MSPVNSVEKSASKVVCCKVAGSKAVPSAAKNATVPSDVKTRTMGEPAKGEHDDPIVTAVVHTVLVDPGPTLVSVNCAWGTERKFVTGSVPVRFVSVAVMPLRPAKAPVLVGPMVLEAEKLSAVLETVTELSPMFSVPAKVPEAT